MGRRKIEIDIQEVERLAGQGLTQEEIALALGISERTLYANKAQSADFADAIKRGKAKTKRTVANKLFERVEAGDLGAIIWFEKTRLGYSEKAQVEHTGKDGKPIEANVKHSADPALVAAAIAVLEAAEGGGGHHDDTEDSE